MSADDGAQIDGEVKTKKEIKLDEPARYKVLLHNDNYTTMQFVVSLLCRVFHKSPHEATAIMMNVHKNGIGKCGTFTKEIAETKVKQVHMEARSAGFPLQCTMEKE